MAFLFPLFYFTNDDWLFINGILVGIPLFEESERICDMKLNKQIIQSLNHGLMVIKVGVGWVGWIQQELSYMLKLLTATYELTEIHEFIILNIYFFKGDITK